MIVALSTPLLPVEAATDAVIAADGGAFASVLARVEANVTDEGACAPSIEIEDTQGDCATSSTAVPADVAAAPPSHDAPVRAHEIPMYDIIQHAPLPAPSSPAPRVEPAPSTDFADELAARTDDEREPAADPRSHPHPAAMHIELRPDDPPSPPTKVVTTTQPIAPEPRAPVTMPAAPRHEPRIDAITPPADRGCSPAATTTTRSSIDRPAAREPASAPTRRIASVRAPITHPTSTPIAAAHREAPTIPSPSTEPPPAIAPTPSTEAPPAIAPLVATPLGDAAPPEPIATTPTPTPASAPEPRTSASIAHEPVVLSRAEDLATAIERLRPIPRGGAVIEVDAPGLGAMRVEVALDDGTVRIRIDSDDARAAAWIEREQHGLTAAARQAAPEASAVELELRHGSGDGRQRAPQRSPDPDHATLRGHAAPTRGAAPDRGTPTPRRGLVDVVA